MLRRAALSSVLIAFVFLLAAGPSDAAKGRKNRSFKLRAPSVDAVYPKAKGTARLRWVLGEPFITIEVKTDLPDGAMLLGFYAPGPYPITPAMTNWFEVTGGKATITELCSFESVDSVTVLDYDMNEVVVFNPQ